MSDTIDLKGVRTNNLKNISVRIPMRKLTVLTGVSGSGKSSLAFDTLYAEGQRRFLESMSTYVRMFLDEMPKPPVDKIENCLPAIALRQQSSFDHPRSTISTVTELLVHLAQLYANMAEFRCPACGGLVGKDTDAEIEQKLRAFDRRFKLILYVELPCSEGESAAQRLTALATNGYQRLWLDGRIVDLSSGDVETLLDLRTIPVLVDRLVFRPETGLDGRFSEALEEAFRLGDDRIKIDILDDAPQTLVFDRRNTCRECHRQYPTLRPENFDPNSTLGACPVCTGFGKVSGIDWKRVINPALPLMNDAVIPLRTPKTYARKEQLLAFCARQKLPIDKPFSELTEEQQMLVKFGKPPYKGVMGYFEYLQSQKKFTARIQLARFRGYTPCEACAGSGMSDIARHARVCGKFFSDLMPMTVSEALAFLESIPREAIEATGSLTPWESALLRLRTMHGVGLGYLALNRKSKTLSGGECQRLHLSCGLGRGLTDTLYVLDEPTAGLHPADSLKLIRVMKQLRDIGNTLVVVEHDADVIREADNLIELGPCGGENGGHIIFQGALEDLIRSDTPTGHMLRSEARTKLTSKGLNTGKFLTIEHATIHNLKDLTVRIPLQQIVTVVGVSGSGKSTLVHDVLYQNWLMHNAASGDFTPDEENEDEDKAEETDTGAVISGFEAFDEVIMMSQKPLGRSSRACVATMTRAFTGIRQIFSEQPQAVSANMTAGWFSFNVGYGRCPECEGIGVKTIEMMFLNDLTVPCPHCGGRRFIPEVLAIRYKGKNISDVLDMTVSEARNFFEEYPSIANPLQTLCDIGLGYVRLGQSTATLSGGEFQRLCIANYLERATRDNARTLFIFDEPTVGLHMQDIENLNIALQRLIARRASVIVIEHNLDLIAQSHHVIELGPEGGPNGGHLLFEGSPKDLSKQDTPTGRALANM